MAASHVLHALADTSHCANQAIKRRCDPKLQRAPSHPVQCAVGRAHVVRLGALRLSFSLGSGSTMPDACASLLSGSIAVSSTVSAVTSKRKWSIFCEGKGKGAMLTERAR